MHMACRCSVVSFLEKKEDLLVCVTNKITLKFTITQAFHIHRKQWMK